MVLVPFVKLQKTQTFQKTNLIQSRKNHTDSRRKLKLSNPPKIILSHLNVNSLQNKIESIADAIQGTFDILLLSETKLDESSPDKTVLVK